MDLPGFVRACKGGTLLTLKVQPRASRDEIGPQLGEALKVKVKAPPVDSAANEAVIQLLARTLDCPRNKIELTHGRTSRLKTFFIAELTPQRAAQALLGEVG